MRIYKFGKSQSWLSLLVTLLAALVVYAQQAGWLGEVTSVLEANQPGLYTVTRFADGDTIVVDMNGRQERVRMIGVDTPETHKPNAPVQCYGVAASAFTKNTIDKQKVRLVSDSLSTNRDRYDRLLRYVYLENGAFLNQEIIRQGYGFYYPHFPFNKAVDFGVAQNEARQAVRGLWAHCQPKPTDGGGYISNDV